MDFDADQSRRGEALPITDIAILALIILSFVIFAVVLAWGDHQTRDIAKASRARALAVAAPAPKKAERKFDEKKPERVPVHA